MTPALALVIAASILQAIGFGVISSLAGRRKNRDTLLWFFIGLAFSIFGFVASLLVEDKPADDRPISKWATASFVCGLLGFLGWFASIPAIACGHVAASKIKKAEGYRGRERYIVGLVLGYAWFALAVATTFLVYFGS